MRLPELTWDMEPQRAPGHTASSHISCCHKLPGLWALHHPPAHGIPPQDTGTAMLSPEQGSRVWCVRETVLGGVCSKKKFLFFLETRQQLLLFPTWLLLFPTWQFCSWRVEVSAQEGTFESGVFLELPTVLGML